MLLETLSLSLGKVFIKETGFQEFLIFSWMDELGNIAPNSILWKINTQLKL